MKNPFDIVREFEFAVAEYTGAPFVVSVSSCTMALLLAVKWHIDCCGLVRPRPEPVKITIPKRTYVSVPMSIIHAGGRVQFDDRDWVGSYQLNPLPVWDCARHFTANMYYPGGFECVSFHATKTLGDTQGGAILHDNPQADAWFRRMRFDGRTEGVAPKNDCFKEIGWHCYMSPDVAARLLLKLSSLPLDNYPLPNDDYPDLSQMEIFK
jgi:dTDP-4-amino-4,6-dideoxygalactose transaminase